MKINRISIIVILISFTFLSAALYAQDNALTPVNKQATELMKFFKDPAGCTKYFAQEFLTQFPPERLNYIFNYYYNACGQCTKIMPIKIDNDYSAKYNFYFEKNFTVQVNINVDTKEPYLITGLFLGNPVSLSANFDDLINEFKKLPGKASLYAAKIQGNEISPVAGYNQDDQFAIGSSFKLYVLSEILRTVNSGERNWSDVLQLREDCISFPSGFLHGWHAGVNMTIESLASLMISISDNTAADNLLYLAGRENVEKILSVTGHSNPAIDIPFLSTVEMFKLKGERTKTLADKFIASGDKKNFLNNEVKNVSRTDVSTWTDPLDIDKIEWFASAKDLCNVMNWIRANSENERGCRVRDVLAINQGLGISPEKWNYVGYKGGSEPGVMNMTYLLRSSAGEWFVLSAGWNNTKANIDENKFGGLVGRAIQLLEK